MVDKIKKYIYGTFETISAVVIIPFHKLETATAL